MAKQLICDLCRKPTDEISAKLYFTKITPEMRRKGYSFHGGYSKHLDVGVCCADKVVKLFGWRDRKTRKEASGRKQRA